MKIRIFAVILLFFLWLLDCFLFEYFWCLSVSILPFFISIQLPIYAMTKKMIEIREQQVKMFKNTNKTSYMNF